MKRIDETDRLSNVNVSVPNNYIPKCKRGIFSHGAEGLEHNENIDAISQTLKYLRLTIEAYKFPNASQV